MPYERQEFIRQPLFINTHVQRRTHTFTYTHLHTRIHTPTHSPTHTHMPTHLPTNTHTHKRLCSLSSGWRLEHSCASSVHVQLFDIFLDGIPGLLYSCLGRVRYIYACLDFKAVERKL